MQLDEQIAAVRRAAEDCALNGRIASAPANRDFWASQADALRSALATLEAQRWRPIETAPKDGTKVLVSHRDGEAETDFYDGGWCTDATHWMPLPAPPALQGGDSLTEFPHAL